MKRFFDLLVRLRLRFTLWLYRLFAKKADGAYYIGGSETLPPPLTRDEEAALLSELSELSDSEAADSGSPEFKKRQNRAEKLRRTLVERNLRLVVYIAKKFDNTGIGIEDLISIGTIGLMKAIKTFDPTKNIKLATYASRCIENEILMFIRKTGNLKTEVSIDEPLSVDWDGNELLLSDVLCCEEETISRELDREEDRRQLRGILNGLCERERRIIILRFGLGGIITEDEREKLLGEICGQRGNLPGQRAYFSSKRLYRENTQKEVAELLGISQSYISRLEKRILEEMKKELLAAL